MFSRLPVYQQLVKKLMDDIVKGRFGPPGAIISARSMARSYKLSRETVSKAMSELQALGYLSCEAGRGFKLEAPPNGRLCMNIGLVATYAKPTIDGFYGNIINGIEQACRRERFLVTWFGPESDGTINCQYLSELHAGGRVDGYIFIAVEDTEVINRFVELGIPSVAVDYHDDALACSSIALDNAGGCELAVEKMNDFGAGNYAIVTREQRDDYSSRERESGYVKALRKLGVDLPNDRIFSVNDTPPITKGKSCSEVMAEQYLAIAKSCGPRTTFLTAYCYHAGHLLWAATKIFPNDILRVTTFGSLSNYDVFGRAIVALQTDSLKMGRDAAALLLENLPRTRAVATKRVFAKMFVESKAPFGPSRAVSQGI